MNQTNEVIDTFFTQEKCDRCSNLLCSRTTSWFSEETICAECANKERELKNEMRKQGINPDEYEGCGFVPDINIIA